MTHPKPRTINITGVLGMGLSGDPFKPKLTIYAKGKTVVIHLDGTMARHLITRLRGWLTSMATEIASLNNKMRGD